MESTLTLSLALNSRWQGGFWEKDAFFLLVHDFSKTFPTSWWRGIQKGDKSCPHCNIITFLMHSNQSVLAHTNLTWRACVRNTCKIASLGPQIPPLMLCTDPGGEGPYADEVGFAFSWLQFDLSLRESLTWETLWIAPDVEGMIVMPMWGAPSTHAWALTHIHPPPKDSRTPGLTLPGLNHTTHSVLSGQNKTYVNRLNAMTTKFQLHEYQGLGEKKTHVEISNSQGNREGTRQKGSQESK